MTLADDVHYQSPWRIRGPRAREQGSTGELEATLAMREEKARWGVELRLRVRGPTDDKIL